MNGAYGVSLVTDFREKGTDELERATAAVRAAKDAGVKHFVWSTLPHNLSYKQVPKEDFAGSFPGAIEIAEMFSYWEAHTYLGSDSSDQIALASKIAGRRPTRFSTWARENFHVQAP